MTRNRPIIECKLILPLAVFIHLLCISLNTHAQNLEIFRLEYSYLPNGQISDGNLNSSVDFSEFEVSFLMPLKHSDTWTFLAGGTYSMAFPQSANNQSDTKLYFIALQGSAIYDFDDKNRIAGFIIPSISSTLEDALSSDDFLTQASIVYLRKASETLRYGLGVMYTSRFGFPQVLPLVTLNHIREKVRYDLSLPLSAQATWAYDSKLSYGLKFNANGSQFNSPQGSEYNGMPVDAVNFSRILIGPELGLRLRGQLYITLYAGISTRRLFELNSDDSPTQDLSLNNGVFISGKISIKPKQENIL